VKEVDLIIFDFDGTLVDSKVDIVNSVNFALERLGLSAKDFDTVAGYIGVGLEHLLLKCLGDGQEDKYQQAYDLYCEHYRVHLLDNSAPYPHVKEILEHFKNKEIAIVSNRLSTSARRMLETFGLAHYFGYILGSENVSCRKPSPCPVLSVIDKFKIPKEKAIIVGDMDLDIKSGKEAGIMTCAVTYGLGKAEDIGKAGPDFIIDDIARLKEIIR
jgi:2-phosphoglycolate phosphatase